MDYARERRHAVIQLSGRIAQSHSRLTRELSTRLEFIV